MLPCRGSNLFVAPLGDTNPTETLASSGDPIESQQGGLMSFNSMAEFVLLLRKKQLLIIMVLTNQLKVLHYELNLIFLTSIKCLPCFVDAGNRQLENSEVDGINLNTLSCCSENMLPFRGSVFPVALVGNLNCLNCFEQFKLCKPYGKSFSINCFEEL